MRQRLFCPILAAAVLITALSGGADRASAAIRITISDGTTDKVFYSTNSQSALFLTDLGAFDVMILTTLSNYPGQASGGALSQTINLSDNAEPTMTPLPTFTFTAAVIADVDGVSSGEVTGDQRTAVQSAPLARFTLPSASSLLVSSDVSSAEPSRESMTGTVQNITTVNDVDVASLKLPVNATVEGEMRAIVSNDPSQGYTLSSRVILEGANTGVTGLAISASSGVTAALVPEPASLAVWGLGGIGLAVAAAGRRRLQQGTVK